MSKDAPAKSPDATATEEPQAPASPAPLEQADVWIRVNDGGFGNASSMPKIRRTAKLLGLGAGPRPASQGANGIVVLATPEEADQIEDGDLISPLGAAGRRPIRVSGDWPR